MQQQYSYSLAVDIGGTFTDAVLRRSDGRAWIDKSLTTYDHLLNGFFNAVDGVLTRCGIRPQDVDDVVVHATTVVTNTVIQRRGAKTALLTTVGFCDILRVRTSSRTNIFDNKLEFGEPLVPRDLTFGIAERTLSDGTIERQVDPNEISEVVAKLRAEGVKSVAICFLHSYKNGHNEQVCGDLINKLAPELYVSLSSRVAPQIREYPRTSTTAINAYTLPMTQPYLNDLVVRLERHGFKQRPLLMLSSGGVVGAEVAGLYPVRMIESGPAAGALAASHFSSLMSQPDLIAFDMGGTTAKCCFIVEGKPFLTTLFEVDRRYRAESGSGMPVTVPCIDMVEIGTGGGSIAELDTIGLLKVGPNSAGSEPGPVCYGRGGRSPTVTDANLILGMLDENNFLGGEFKLDFASAEKALEDLARELKVSLVEAATGIYRIAGDSMAAAIRSHASDHGLDWRGFPILAFGGAGPIHACYVAESLECGEVIFPPLASVLSAYGALVTPIRLDLVRSDFQKIKEIDWEALNLVFQEMMDAGREALISAGCEPDEIRFSFGADFRYVGQQSEVSVELSHELIKKGDPAGIRAAFEEQYMRQYAVVLTEGEVEVTSWRTAAHGPDRTGEPTVGVGTVRDAKDARRRIVQFAREKVDTPVFARSSLNIGDRLQGPAIIEERETTIVIPPGWRVKVDDFGCIIANFTPAAHG